MWLMAKRPAQTRRKTEGNNNATAKDAGPSAAAWPERREMARAPRHGPSAARAAATRAPRIAVCGIEAEARASHVGIDYGAVLTG